MRYTHYFDVRVAQRFESDIEDFDEALDQWLCSFDTTTKLRNALLTSDESTKSLTEGVIHSDTCVNDDPEPEPGPTYVVWSASPDDNEGWEAWQAEASFTCDDDPDGKGARQSAHEHARYLRRTYHGHLIAVRHHDRGLPLNPAQPVVVDPPYKDFSAAWLGL